MTTKTKWVGEWWWISKRSGWLLKLLTELTKYQAIYEYTHDLKVFG